MSQLWRMPAGRILPRVRTTRARSPHLSAFFHDLVHGVLHFEGKIWRTLPMLAWRPGEWTRRYIDGERARFVSPIALFLFSVFLMFAVISASGAPFGVVKIDGGLDRSIDQSIADEKRGVAALEKKRATSQGQRRATSDQALIEKRQDLALLERMKSDGVTSAIISRDDKNFYSSSDWIRTAYARIKRNPQLMIYNLQSASYKFSWALSPISVPFLWLLFPFSRRFRLYDHTVFVTYSLCFVSLLVVALSLLRVTGVDPGLAVLLLMVVPPVHFCAQLKGTYSLSQWGAAWRALALTWFASIAIGLFGLMVLAMGISE